ncbi:hypothetical protein [Nocardiopsis sp. YSL2]|uniref:hypothetical protein n=1 Tax=Nocardiopsis sp. YSL2 TaxID=2939492 RepID=UPI0026F41037|nr:hypothetical protein [Nocardiopsis sp. YSL2]
MTTLRTRRRRLAAVYLAVLVLLTTLAIALWATTIRDHGTKAVLFFAAALAAPAAYYALTRWTPLTPRVLDRALLVIGNTALIPMWVVLGPRPLVYVFTALQIIVDILEVRTWIKNRRERVAEGATNGDLVRHVGGRVHSRSSAHPRTLPRLRLPAVAVPGGAAGARRRRRRHGHRPPHPESGPAPHLRLRELPH